MQALIWSKMSTGLPIEITSSMKNHETVNISLTGMRLITTENEKLLSNRISKSDQTVLLTGSKLTQRQSTSTVSQRKA